VLLSCTLLDAFLVFNNDSFLAAIVYLFCTLSTLKGGLRVKLQAMVSSVLLNGEIPTQQLNFYHLDAKNLQGNIK